MATGADVVTDFDHIREQMMSELTEWLRQEAQRNSQLQGDKAHTSRRRSNFRHRAHRLNQAADALETAYTEVSNLKLANEEAAEALRELQARSDANADHARLANENQASARKALKNANARIEQLEGALRPFADVHIAMSEPNRIIDPYEHITLHDLRMAAEALQEQD